MIYWNKTRIYVPNDQSIRSKILKECHDIPVSGHVGVQKTLEQVKKIFYWPKLRNIVERYVTTCLACQQNKATNKLQLGLLQPLPIPDKPWQQVTMDLITQLPRTVQGHDAIVVFVDKLTKMVHCCATTTSVTAPELATIFFQEVVRLHGIPASIVSDRDTRFTSLFWQSLWGLIGTSLDMSTAFHPQTDGQTERANRTIEEMMRAYTNCHQDDWDEHLTAIEIACNNSVHASTNHTPYYLNSGQEFQLPISTINASAKFSNQSAEERIQLINSSIERAKQYLLKAQERQTLYANANRRDVELKVGDKVLLSTEDLNLVNGDRRRKLIPKFIGPFDIIRVVSRVAYELKLPSSMRIHNVFHVSKFKLFKPSDGLRGHDEQVDRRPPPEIIDGEEAWEVEGILNHRYRRYGRGGRLEYLVKWVGFPNHESSWIPASNMAYAQDLIDEYEEKIAQQNRRSTRRRQ